MTFPGDVHSHRYLHNIQSIHPHIIITAQVAFSLCLTLLFVYYFVFFQDKYYAAVNMYGSNGTSYLNPRHSWTQSAGVASIFQIF